MKRCLLTSNARLSPERKRRLVKALVFGAAAVAGGLLLASLLKRSVAKGPLIKPGDRVWVLGDSQAVGLLYKEFPRLAAQDGVEISGDPLGGTAIFQWNQWSRLKARVQAGKDWGATVFLVLLGTNDANMNVDLIEKEKTDLAEFLANMRSQGARVVWIGPPKLKTLPNGDMVVNMIQATGVDYLDSREIDFPMWDDYIHPSIPGRTIWAEWAWAKMRKR